MNRARDATVSRIAALATDLRKAGEITNTMDICQEARQFHVSATALMAAQTEGDLSKDMPVPWARFFARQIGHEPRVTSLGETLLQVALHTQYHRGQINRLIRELGGEPPMVDYIGWVWA